MPGEVLTFHPNNLGTDAAELDDAAVIRGAVDVYGVETFARLINLCAGNASGLHTSRIYSQGRSDTRMENVLAELVLDGQDSEPDTHRVWATGGYATSPQANYTQDYGRITLRVLE